MASFKDAVGKEWTLAVTPYEYRKIKDALGVDLYDIVDKDKAKQVFAKIETDDILLSDILWQICQSDAEGCGVDQKSFLRSLPGSVLAEAYMSLLEAIRDFFRRPEHRMIMEKMISFVRAVQSRVETEVTREVAKVDTEQQAKTFIDSVMSSLAVSGSTPSQQGVTADGDTPSAN